MVSIHGKKNSAGCKRDEDEFRESADNDFSGAAHIRCLAATQQFQPPCTGESKPTSPHVGEAKIRAHDVGTADTTEEWRCRMSLIITFFVVVMLVQVLGEAQPEGVHARCLPLLQVLAALQLCHQDLQRLGKHFNIFSKGAVDEVPTCAKPKQIRLNFGLRDRRQVEDICREL